jgi:hypothetical protein
MFPNSPKENRKMNIKNCRIYALLPLLLLVASCSSNPAGTLTLTGQAVLASFPAPATAVRAIRGQEVVEQAPVGVDGRFSMSLPAGRGYHLEFIYGNGDATLVFPRSSGAIGSKFDVLGSTGFDLGLVRYIGDPAGQSFYFRDMSGSSGSDEADADGDEVECEDGVDPATGSVCVDDDDEEFEGMCSDEEGEKEDEADDVECENGIDPATGAECEGGPAANPDDSDEDTPSDAAVADHNLPAGVGCADEDNDDIECENGIDPATGEECEGGPAANPDDGED